jgi:hypothetical protein
VLRTTDGQHWQKLSSPTRLDLVAVEARDVLHISVTAADGQTYVSFDGGRTWRAK